MSNTISDIRVSWFYQTRRCVGQLNPWINQEPIFISRCWWWYLIYHTPLVFILQLYFFVFYVSCYNVVRSWQHINLIVNSCFSPNRKSWPLKPLVAFHFWETWMLNFLPTAFLFKVIIASTVDVFVYVKIVSATLYLRYLARENYLDL